MRKVLKTLMSLLLIAAMLLSMATVTFAEESKSTGAVELSTNGIEELTFGEETFTGAAVTAKAVIEEDYFLGWNEGFITYDSEIFEYAGIEYHDMLDDGWVGSMAWTIAESMDHVGEVQVGLGTTEVAYSTQDMVTIYLKLKGDAADYSGQTTEFTLGGPLLAADTAMPMNMPTTFTGTSITFPVVETPLYTITYMVNGELYDTVEYEEGAAVTPLAAPTKDGHTFSGWVGEPTTMPAENVTVTGTFTEDVVESETSGSCGTSATWSYADGVLTISGTGAMTNFTSSNIAPWTDYLADITEINIAEGITAIGNRAFAGTAVTELTIPSTVTTIGAFAFLNSTALTTVNMSGGAVLGGSAFKGCTALTTINYTGTIDQYKATIAVAGDSNLEFLRAEATITDGDVVSKASMSIFATWVYNGADNTLEIGNCPNYSAREMLNFKNAEAIPWAEYINEITKVTVKDVALVGSRTMYGSTSVKELDVQTETVKRINSWAFFNATALSTVQLPASIEALGTGAFYGNALTSVTSAATNEQYGKIVFAKTNDEFKRTTVILADAVRGMQNDSSTGSVVWTLKDGVLTLSGTGQMIKKSSGANQPWYDYESQIKEVVVEAGITRIGEYAFEGLTNVETITIPETVDYINAYAFANCASLVSVDIPKSVTRIYGNVFDGCTNFTTVNYAGSTSDFWNITMAPGTKTTLQSKELVADDNVYVANGEVTSTMFWKLTDTGVLYIEGSGAMPAYSTTSKPGWNEYKANIKAVIIKNGVTTIGAQAFANATSLISIDVPVTLTTVAKQATYGCSALTTINYAGTADQFSAITVGASNDPFTAATVNYAE